MGGGSMNKHIERKIVELSCGVGDTVYIKGKPAKISFIHIEEEPIYCIQIDCFGVSCHRCPFKGSTGYYEFSDDDIGKTVFLTKEETEE